MQSELVRYMRQWGVPERKTSWKHWYFGREREKKKKDPLDKELRKDEARV